MRRCVEKVEGFEIASKTFEMADTSSFFLETSDAPVTLLT